MQKRWKRLFAFFLLLSFLLASCTGDRQYSERGYAMGAYISISAWGNMPQGLLGEITGLENQISHRIVDSQVSRASRGEAVEISAALENALTLCGELTERTGGRFDITLLPVTQLWHFDEGGALPNGEALSAALMQVGYSQCVSLQNGVLSLPKGGLDLGAVGKGMACDLAISRLREAGGHGIVSVGGSIGLLSGEGSGEYRIGVRDPFVKNGEGILSVISLAEGFVSTSGSYEKYFEAGGIRYHHILDATTGRPAQGELVSVTAVASSGALSDALSTALFLVGVEEGLALCAQYGAEAIFVSQDGTCVATKGLSGKLEMAEGWEVVYR